MTSRRAESLLKWIFRVLGAFMVVAFVPMLMPTAWMETANDWLGLDPFQRSVLMEYLTRTLSGVYGILGLLSLYVSRDVVRYRDLIAFFAWVMVGFAIFLTILDFRIGMPASWSWTEGPPSAILGLVVIWLTRHVETRPGAG